MRCPAVSTATHRPAERQETPLSDCPASIGATDQLGGAPAGASLASTLPSASTSTHTPTSLHETAFSALVTIPVRDHVGFEPLAFALA